MKKLCTLIITTLTLSSLILAKEVQSDVKLSHVKMVGNNPYTYAPQIFNAENHTTGFYWAGDGSQQYPGKAYIGEIEYTDIVVIAKSKIKTTQSKKMRKHKIFLGSFIKNNKIHYLYGVKKIQDTVDKSPDADVLTVIAMKEDFGPGE